MDQLADVSLSSLTTPSNFVKPMRLKYKQDGVDKIWDLLLSRPSVAVVIYNKTRKRLILVKQLRPTVLVSSALRKNPDIQSLGNTVKDLNVQETGITTEICAGIMDKSGKSAQEIARLEVLEECGYDVPLDQVEEVQTVLGAVGTSGETMTLFYAEVTDAMKVNQGGGVAEEGEYIEVIEMSIDEVKSFLKQKSVLSPSFTIQGLMWFLLNKSD